ncbi:MAG TPA: hypothetical protein VH597_17875 [Verrucomicrobiae bacterium]|jgi:hypothetical protein|nr:hypothetical protein [Verrucomicrobiae bacterium]
MKTNIPLLLRWHLAQLENQAPPPPRAARLLAQTQPWWDTWPERFQALVERLSHMDVAFGHAMTDASHVRTGFPVTTLVEHAGEETETSARVLYLSLRDRRFCFRFHLNANIQPAVESFEVTFITDGKMTPVLSASAARSVDNEYRVDLQVSEELAREWGNLKVTDRMPFRLLLRSASSISDH